MVRASASRRRSHWWIARAPGATWAHNGHSYIRSGPLDPTRFTRDDFSKAYQILWVDECVSYNYYHKDYIPLKEGGTKNLDLITNGLEAPSYRSGISMGQFLARFLSSRAGPSRGPTLSRRVRRTCSAASPTATSGSSTGPC
jgi:hypothetical protein